MAKPASPKPGRLITLARPTRSSRRPAVAPAAAAVAHNLTKASWKVCSCGRTFDMVVDAVNHVRPTTTAPAVYTNGYQ